jgi:hypothetical protein
MACPPVNILCPYFCSELAPLGNGASSSKSATGVDDAGTKSPSELLL